MSACKSLHILDTSFFSGIWFTSVFSWPAAYCFHNICHGSWFFFFKWVWFNEFIHYFQLLHVFCVSVNWKRVCSSESVEVRGQPSGFSFLLHHVGTGFELTLSSLAAGTIAGWAILLALNFPFMGHVFGAVSKYFLPNMGSYRFSPCFLLKQSTVLHTHWNSWCCGVKFFFHMRYVQTIFWIYMIYYFISVLRRSFFVYEPLLQCIIIKILPTFKDWNFCWISQPELLIHPEVT